MHSTLDSKQDFQKVKMAESTQDQQSPTAASDIPKTVEGEHRDKPHDKESTIAQKEPPPKGRSRALVIFTILLLICGCVWLFYWFTYLRFHESTDDAYANGNFISINSAINGSVIAFYADDTDFVKEGELLVLLDSTSYQMIYERELATLASIVLQVRQLYDNVEISRSNVENKAALVERANFNYNNRLQLQKTNPKAVSNEDFVHSAQDLTVAESDLRHAKFELASAEAAAGNGPIENHPLIEQQRATILTAFYNLQHCSIYAPNDGYIAQRTVEVGQWITPNTGLMALIPIKNMWVDANFKETQLANMRIGQPATVWFDLYGSKAQFEGHVIGIASGTGSVFSLIPPQNATGNWIKIVQRLPVRISLDQDKMQNYPIRLGISATVDIDITDQDLPLLATSPLNKPVSTTRVFNLDLEKVNSIIETVIRENLKKESS